MTGKNYSLLLPLSSHENLIVLGCCSSPVGGECERDSLFKFINICFSGWFEEEYESVEVEQQQQQQYLGCSYFFPESTCFAGSFECDTLTRVRVERWKTAHLVEDSSTLIHVHCLIVVIRRFWRQRSLLFLCLYT